MEGGSSRASSRSAWDPQDCLHEAGLRVPKSKRATDFLTTVAYQGRYARLWDFEQHDDGSRR